MYKKATSISLLVSASQAQPGGGAWGDAFEGIQTMTLDDLMGMQGMQNQGQNLLQQIQQAQQAQQMQAQPQMAEEPVDGDAGQYQRYLDWQAQEDVLAQYQQPYQEQEMIQPNYLEQEMIQPNYQQPEMTYQQPEMQQIYQQPMMDQVYQEPVQQAPEVQEALGLDDAAYQNLLQQVQQLRLGGVPEQPQFEQPTFEEPTYEQPMYEQPMYEQPMYEQPTQFQAPIGDQPIDGDTAGQYQRYLDWQAQEQVQQQYLQPAPVEQEVAVDAEQYQRYLNWQAQEADPAALVQAPYVEPAIEPESYEVVDAEQYQRYQQWQAQEAYGQQIPQMLQEQPVEQEAYPVPQEAYPEEQVFEEANPENPLLTAQGWTDAIAEANDRALQQQAMGLQAQQDQLQLARLQANPQYQQAMAGFRQVMENGPTQTEGAPIISDLTAEDLGYLALAFVVFTVSFAVVRNLFGRMWGRIPEKERNNWKQSFKRRLGRDTNSGNNAGGAGNDPNARDSAFGGAGNGGGNGEGNQGQNDGNTGFGSSPYDYQALGDLPDAKKEEAGKGAGLSGVMGKLWGAKKTGQDELQNFQRVSGSAQPSEANQWGAEVYPRAANANIPNSAQMGNGQQNAVSSAYDSAKNMMGVGLGSKYNPIKAAAVVDDDEEEKTNADGHQIIQARVVNEDPFVQNIMTEVDEIVQLDGTTPSYMVMDEGENL